MARIKAKVTPRDVIENKYYLRNLFQEITFIC